MSNPKTVLQLIFAGVPLVLTFVREFAADMIRMSEPGHQAMTAPSKTSDITPRAHARWHWSEDRVSGLWRFAWRVFCFPPAFLIMTDIVRLALFALSLDLILGYAGIVSLGHARVLRRSAPIAPDCSRLHGIVTEPVLALLIAGLVAAAVGFFHQLPGDQGGSTSRA